jgi:phage FluMu protein Com
MQVRCFHCHKPFALGRDALHAALEEMTAGGMNHYNAHCPHCRRANRLSRAEMLRASPGWTPAKQAEETPAP